ncbi:MAG TPA: hypothetical protein VM221_03085 [Armatimonadota bacterium]|nr:hypothetical protein [Armatimonadota bacterium]
MKIAMTEHITIRSFRTFISERLPAALAAVAPLTDYRVEETAPGVGRVTVSLQQRGAQHTVVFDGLPVPREDGSFAVDGGERAVFMTASSNDLEQAEIKAVGEQLMDQIAPRLAAPPADAEWDEAVLRAWFPLDRWLREFVSSAGTANWLDNVNALSRVSHLRRMWVLGADAAFHPTHIGRVCPYDTPEGPNHGRVLTLALGADVQNGRIVPAEDRGEAAIGLAASLMPLLCHNDPARQLTGVVIMRQWVPQAEPELPLVRSGNEPEDGSFSPGRDFLTAYIHWKGMTYEEGIVMSESAAARLASPQPLEVGDKLSNRHGAKGVVAAILPDDDMPHLPDGRAVELIFDPMGVYSRLNFGQMIEGALGLVAEKRGAPIVAPPFRRTTPEELHGLLRDAGLPESGQFILRDGKDGPELDEPSTVGVVYWGKTVHLASQKIQHFLSEPLPWRRRGGQLAGRNEYLALRTVGANENILDAYLTRAPLDEKGDELLERVAGGFLPEHASPPSAAFRRLQRALRTAMIDLAWCGDHVETRWATPGEGDLELAAPVEHPWQAEAKLTHVGPTDWEQFRHQFEDYRPKVASLGQGVTEANQRLEQALRSGAPAPVQQAARAALRRVIDELFASLLTRGDIDFYTRPQFSGRATLAPGYDLKLGQLGLPEEMAWALFGPLVVGRGGAGAVESRNDEARRAVEGLMAESVVVLNRAPTWEPTSITAFTPVMRPDRCLHLHPSCCRMFNADFDGDQAAVWLPISEPAQREAKEKLTVAAHLRRDPTVVMYHLAPSHAVLGGLAYACESPEGRAAFEAVWPRGCPPPAGPLTRGGVVSSLLSVYEAAGAEAALELLDNLHSLGVTWATKSGASFSPFVGEGLRLPSPPASRYSASWYAYRSLVDAAIAAQADADPTLKAPMRAVRCEARGSVAAIRATVGPWTVSDCYVPEGPITHGFRDGLTAEELWILVAKTRERFLGLHESQLQLAISRRLSAPEGATLLRRAMAAENPAAILAQAADAGEADPLTDPDVRLWIGLLPEANARAGCRPTSRRRG